MPELNINAATIVSELEKIKQKLLQVESSMVSTNQSNLASLMTLNAGLIMTTAYETGYTNSVNANSASSILNSASMLTAVGQMSLLNQQLLATTTSLNAFTAAWNMSTIAIGLNNIAAQASNDLLVANSLALVANMELSIAGSTVSDLQRKAFELLSGAIGGCTEKFSENTETQKDNAKFSLLCTAMNLLQAASVFILNKMMKTQGVLLLGLIVLFKKYMKEVLIGAIVNLGSALATSISNKTAQKQLALLQGQIQKQHALNGALAATAILQNPITGLITVGLATGAMVAMTKADEIMNGKNSSAQSQQSASIASDDDQLKLTGRESALALPGIGEDGEKVGYDLPFMATGGVVTRPTVAMIGEGRYNEAVIPLGNSPQMSTMKNDIANAVVQSILAVQNMSKSSGAESEQLILNMDGQKVAQILLPKLAIEQKRRSGYKVV